MAEKYLVRVGDDDIGFELSRDDEGLSVRREDDEAWRRCHLERVGDSDLYLLMIDNRPTELYLERQRGGALVTIGRHVYETHVGPWRPLGQRSHAAAGQKGVARIVAPMTGGIVEVRCVPGDVVEQGQVLLVIESMKMNNELRSPADGTVESVPVQAGQRVKANELLVAIKTGE